MSSLQVIIFAGVVASTGVWLVVRPLIPVHADLSQSLDQLVGTAEPFHKSNGLSWESMSGWIISKLPSRLRPLPHYDLALVGMSASGFLSRKVGYALVGLLAPGALFGCLMIAGVHFLGVVPGVVGCGLGVVGFLLPDSLVRRKATSLRTEFSFTLGCFVNLVALERSCGVGTRQGLVSAASVGDSWVFSLLKEALDEASWAGLTPGDGLKALGEKLGITDLIEIADIINLSSGEGAGIYRLLRAKARSIQERLLLSELTSSHEANEKMSLPVSLLGIIFLAIVIGPALLTMMGTLP
ncbi:MAG: hypothetical protein FWG15_07100 [Propionibacteriaceae bacterium]|nr:hypothetical protein [Propionibacteriaceae bacterium]